MLTRWALACCRRLRCAPPPSAVNHPPSQRSRVRPFGWFGRWCSPFRALQSFTSGQSQPNSGEGGRSTRVEPRAPLPYLGEAVFAPGLSRLRSVPRRHRFRRAPSPPILPRYLPGIRRARGRAAKGRGSTGDSGCLAPAGQALCKVGEDRPRARERLRAPPCRSLRGCVPRRCRCAPFAGCGAVAARRVLAAGAAKEKKKKKQQRFGMSVSGV